MTLAHANRIGVRERIRLAAGMVAKREIRPLLQGLVERRQGDGLERFRLGSGAFVMGVARVLRSVVQATKAPYTGRSFVILRDRPFDCGDAVAEVVGSQVRQLRKPIRLYELIEDAQERRLAMRSGDF